MKIVITLDENDEKNLSPARVYRNLYTEYGEVLRKRYNKNLWGMVHSCDYVAREAYAHIKDRKPSVTNLILTYSDAQRCFDIFVRFANVWAELMNNGNTTGAQ